jgi:phosphoglycerate dehydrogenase-like enzyme
MSRPVLLVPPATADEYLSLLPAGVEVHRAPTSGDDAAIPPTVDLLVPSFVRPEVLGLIPHLNGLRVIQTLSAGVDWILPVVPPGVVLCDAAGVHDISVSEWVVAAILAMQKRFPHYLDDQRRALWTRPGSHDASQELQGLRVLIVGYGSIARATERRLAPFDVDIVRVARRGRDGVHATTELPSLIANADVVIILLPLTDETRGMIDASLIGRMRHDALLVNAARGAIVDTDALTTALLEGRIRAALDVVDPEPLPADHPIWGAPGLLITPHVAGSTPRFRGRAWRFIADQVTRFLDGEPLLNVVHDGY